MSRKELQVRQRQEVKHDGETTKPEKYFVPAVDIYESDTEVVVIAEMPGVPGDGVDIALEENVLTISGSKKKDTVADAKILLHEYESGNFLRRFTVAETIDQDAISASINNGVLKIVLPKSAPAQPRKIEVTTG